MAGIFDRWTKRATSTAIETTKESLNEKLETYSGIIKIGLTLGVILFGSKKIGQHMSKPMSQTYSQPPIIINNYYDRRPIYESKRPAYKEHKNGR